MTKVTDILRCFVELKEGQSYYNIIKEGRLLKDGSLNESQFKDSVDPSEYPRFDYFTQPNRKILIRNVHQYREIVYGRLKPPYAPHIWLKEDLRYAGYSLLMWRSMSESDIMVPDFKTVASSMFEYSDHILYISPVPQFDQMLFFEAIDISQWKGAL